MNKSLKNIIILLVGVLSAGTAAAQVAGMPYIVPVAPPPAQPNEKKQYYNQLIN